MTDRIRIQLSSMPVPRTSGLAHVLRMADEALLAWSPAVPIAVHPSHQILLRIDPGLDPYWKPTDPKVGAQPAAASSPSLRSAARRWPTPVAFRTSIAPFGCTPVAPPPPASVSGMSARGPHAVIAFRGRSVPSRSLVWCNSRTASCAAPVRRRARSYPCRCRSLW